ncbi:MAG: DNA polymerase IV [Massilioclostridium sp.]|nr:DNA polymerase IV [Massilioclostridium sp.]
MKRTILHLDCDCFYASVELLHRPELRNKPLAVGGDPEQRHGIILAKSYSAKKYGIKTGEALWQAKQKCPDLVIVPPNFKLYMRFSGLIRNILMDYSDQVESFGLDESWIDCTGSVSLLGNRESVAREIQRRVWRELGITVSIGVSWNKVFAKLGSDYKKPCGITVIDKDNYKSLVWPLPVSDLLMVGRATTRKLNQRMISTIGQLAQADPYNLQKWLGKYGLMLHTFANGFDTTPVAQFDSLQIIKSIGNSTTTPRDLETDEDVRLIVFVLAESVARRMREHGFKGRLISINVRDSGLLSFTRQHKIKKYTCLASEIAEEAMRLFRANYHWQSPIRSIGISVSDFEHEASVLPQLDLFTDESKRIKRENLERTMDSLKHRFGNYSVQRASLLTDPDLTGFDPYSDHTIHPISFLR